MTDPFSDARALASRRSAYLERKHPTDPFSGFHSRDIEESKTVFTNEPLNQQPEFIPFTGNEDDRLPRRLEKVVLERETGKRPYKWRQSEELHNSFRKDTAATRQRQAREERTDRIRSNQDDQSYLQQMFTDDGLEEGELEEGELLEEDPETKAEIKVEDLPLVDFPSADPTTWAFTTADGKHPTALNPNPTPPTPPPNPNPWLGQINAIAQQNNTTMLDVLHKPELLNQARARYKKSHGYCLLLL